MDTFHKSYMSPSEFTETIVKIFKSKYWKRLVYGLAFSATPVALVSHTVSNELTNHFVYFITTYTISLILITYTYTT
tara:strand:- start:622 stop:852 length:231 start_codon:yes stop_codon:yes gene_type:complete